MGRIPEEDEKPVVDYEGYTFKVELIDDKRIERVKACRAI
jgi:putative hemolysin